MFITPLAIAVRRMPRWNFTFDRLHRRWTGEKPRSSSGEASRFLVRKELRERNRASKAESWDNYGIYPHQLLGQGSGGQADPILEGSEGSPPGGTGAWRSAPKIT